MKFMLMMNCPKTGYESFGSLPKKGLQDHSGFQRRFDRSLRESSAIAAAASAAPELGGAPMNIPIEVPQPMSRPSQEYL
jgi:hypothetical protein